MADASIAAGSGIDADASGPSEFATVRRTARLMRGEWRTALGVAALGVLSAGLEVAGLSLLTPLAHLALGGGDPMALPGLAPVIDAVAPWARLTEANVTALAVGAMMAGIAVGYANALLSNALAMRAGDDLRRRVFEIALREPVADIEAMPEGRLTNTLASETWRVGDALFAMIGAAVNAVTCAVFLSAMVALSPPLTALLIALSLGMAAAVQAATRAMKALGAAAVAANESFMAELWDALGGLRLVRAYGREDLARARFADRSARVRRVFARLGAVSSGVGPLTESMTILTVAALLGAALAMGESVEMMVGFLAIAYRMQPRVIGILKARSGLRALDASVATVDEAVRRAEAAERAGRTAPGSEPPRGAVRRIAFDGVTARWPAGATPALVDARCVFEGGAITAVVGRSGAGKSTLAATLLGFLAPQSGRLLVDGVPLRSLDSAAWRRRVAFVDQSAHLFDATLADNIRFGAPDADDAAVVAAARAAGAHDFIRDLPEGYDTPATRRRLSSGQKQRVALARALLRAPDVLILDEATNALDLPTERVVMAALAEQARRGAVVVVIAHRREAIAGAARAVVVDGGRIVETGAIGELAARGGAFAALYAAAPSQEDEPCPG
jgi:ABC-type multidrug transport system fused ATPase/permease subunit